MYQDDYKRWMEADLQLRLSLELQDFAVFLEQVRTG